MVKKTNKFNVKKFEDNKIIIQEEWKERSRLSLFFARNGRLIFAISSLFSITVFIIAFYLIMINMNKSSIVMYEENGVEVTFDSSDNTILNGIPITGSYANKVFESVVNFDDSNGVVIEVDRKEIKIKGVVDRTVIYYSDGSSLIKYKDGGYKWVSSIKGEFAVNDEDGSIDSRATTRDLSGIVEKNNTFGITLLYLSDGSVEVSKDSVTVFVRNSDITNDKNSFYTNLSGVSIPVYKENGNTYYSDGTIKENNGIIIEGRRYESTNKVDDVYDNIKIIYYTNGYAEVVKDNFSIMVKEGIHIIYDDNNLEIIFRLSESMEIKDIMDIKEIKLNNTNNSNCHYIIVLEETDNYQRYNINKRLDNKMINYNVYVNGIKSYNNVLNKNLKENNLLEGINFDNNTYLLYEGTLNKQSETVVKLGLWVDYVEDRITNEYMNSAFIGTIKIYIEELN